MAGAPFSPYTAILHGGIQSMKRRNLLTGAAATLASAPLARPHAQKPVTIRWYYFSNAKVTPDEMVAAFEKENPGIKIEAENIPWGGGGDYDNRLYTSIIAGNGPDTAIVKFNNPCLSG